MISIIIPAKNEERYLSRLLDSIRMQNVKNLEIIVADAASIDKTAEIASAYGCRIVEGGKPSVGRNNGAKYSFGDMLIFKDADSPFPSNFLIPAINEFNERKLDVAGTLQHAFTEKNGFAKFRYDIYMQLVNLFLKSAQYTKRPLMQNCMFARKEIHEKIGGFNENIEFGEDSEYAKRAKNMGYNFGILKSCGKTWFSIRRFEKNEIKILLKTVYFNAGSALGHEFRKDGAVRYW